MKLHLRIAVIFACLTFAAAADKKEEKKPDDGTVFREPFTLTLHVDKEHKYEEKFDKIPFVHKDQVYLFKGDEFGLTLEVKDNEVKSVKYQPDLKKADVTLRFTQDVKDDGSATMMLKIVNRTKQKLGMDGLMTVPGKKGIGKTNLLPVDTGLSSFESWPHPIVQLVLRGIRIEK